MNFIMNLQTFIKQWNQYLKLSQMPNFDVTTPKQYVGGATCTCETQIIIVVQGHFLKMKMNKH